MGCDAARFCIQFSGSSLALALFVARVLADHHDVSVSTNNLALVANRLDAWVDLHCFLLFRWRRTR